MHNQPTSLNDLGQRICVFGPSSSGKSTLAEAISKKLQIEAIHVDQLFHEEHGNWIARDEAEFLRLHTHAIQAEAWVMDGNYSVSIPDRLSRATGIILFSTNRWGNLWRYILRGVFVSNRIGGLPGGQDTLSWSMVRHILIVSPTNERRRLDHLKNSGLPFVHICGFSNIKKLFEAWDLASS